MTGICGWTVRALAESDWRSTAARMLHVPNAAPTPTSLRFAESQTATLAASHPHGMADAASDRGVSAVIEGFFRFTDQSLAGVASSGSAARALITGYAAHGPRVLALLDGAFSVAIWNADRREMLLATDRFAIRPVVYAPLPDGIAFGPDANGLREHPSVRATLDSRAIFDYLYFSAIPSPSTIYRELRRLEPAQYVLWLDGQIRAERYWIPAFQPGHEDTASLNRDLHEVLSGAIARCDPDRDAGAFLSGGLDSSTVSGMLARHQTGTAKTFTIGFDAEGYDEIGYARIASSHFGNTAHEYYVTPCDVVDTIDRIATAYDEPFGNSSAVPTFYCARLAAETGVSTILAGDGGDEIFAGNERYAKQKVFETWRRVPSALRRGLVEPLAFHLPFGGRLFPVRKLRRYIEQARVPLPDRLQTYNFLHMTPLADIFAPGFLRDIEPDRPLALLREEYRRVEGDFVNRMLYLDWKFTLADNDLRKVTVMCEQAGIEVRYPMLDNAVVEFSTHIPTGILLPRFRLRHFYREAMRGFLPDEILSKRKHGFGLPFGVWLATSPELMSVVDQCFAGMRKREIFRADFLDDILRRHRTKHASFYGTTVWLIIVLEKWLAARRL